MVTVSWRECILRDLKDNK